MRSIFLSSLSILTLAACGGASTPVDELCEHLTEGPASAVTAVAGGDGPLIADDHKRYDVTLVPGTGGNVGRVRFSADESGEFEFGLTADVPVAFSDVSGAAVMPEATEKASASCSAQKALYVLDLVVGTYTLEFGPTQEGMVGVVVEHGAHAE